MVVQAILYAPGDTKIDDGNGPEVFPPASMRHAFLQFLKAISQLMETFTGSEVSTHHPPSNRARMPLPL